MLAGLAVAAIGGWTYLWGREAVPETTSYELDISELRRLAGSVPGERPLRINHEQISEAPMPLGVVFAWKSISTWLPFSHGAYQVVYPDGFGMIDSGFDEASAKSMSLGEPRPFSSEGYAAIERGLAAARWIVITHEHGDHVGGIVKYESPSDLAGRLVLTPEQLANTTPMSGLTELPAALREASSSGTARA